MNHLDSSPSASLPSPDSPEPASRLPADLASIPPGISLRAVKALYYIREQIPNQGQLADLLGVSRADVTGITDRLEGKGLVSRVRSKADRRSTLVSPTQQGLVLADQIFGTKPPLSPKPRRSAPAVSTRRNRP